MRCLKVLISLILCTFFIGSSCKVVNAQVRQVRWSWVKKGAIWTIEVIGGGILANEVIDNLEVNRQKRIAKEVGNELATRCENYLDNNSYTVSLLMNASNARPSDWDLVQRTYQIWREAIYPKIPVEAYCEELIYDNGIEYAAVRPDTIACHSFCQ